MMRVEFGKILNELADRKGSELSAQEIFQAFEREYLQRSEPLALERFRAHTTHDGAVECHAKVLRDGKKRELSARGNGPIDAFVVALCNEGLAKFDVLNFAEHSLEGGAEARAVAYVQIGQPDGSAFYGAAIDTNIETASIKAVLSAVNRAIEAS
jgi:2-isopropylmalate synthase